MRLRKGFWVYLPVAIFAWFAPVTVVNAAPVTTTGASDFYFPFDSPQLFTVRAYAWQYGIDSQLWFYDSTNTVVAVNDDYFGLDSFISIGVSAGTYRLRTSVCCGDPNRWYGTSYTIDANFVPVEPTTTTTTELPTTTVDSTTTTVVETTTTSSTTSTTTTTTSTTTEPPTTTTESTTTTSSAPQTTVPLLTTTTSTYPPQTVPVTLFLPSTTVDVPEETTTTIVEETSTTVAPQEEITTTTEVNSTFPDNTVETSTSTIAPNLEPNLEPLTTEEVTAVVEQLSAITEITPEVLSAVVDALNSGNITDEQVQQIVDAVVKNLDTITELTPEVLNQVLDILESDSVTQDQVQSIVDSVLATDISNDQATQLATSAAVLENITGDQATEVFASIDESSITDTQAAAIVEALLNAPAEVKQAFEAEINVFQGGFDEYVPTGSVISVGGRRVVVAVTTVSFVLPAPVVSRRKQRV